MGKCRKRQLYEPDTHHDDIFWDDYGWNGPLTEQQTGEIVATLLLYNQQSGGVDNADQSLAPGDKGIMYQSICRRAHLGIQDAVIMPLGEAGTNR
jgi:hypothetical protein